MQFFLKLLILFLLCFYVYFYLENPIAYSETSSKIVINNFRPGYHYIIYLNNEPIYYGEDLTLFSWDSWPIKKGNNDLRFEFTPYIRFKNPKVQLEISIFDQSQRIEVDTVKLILTEGETKQYLKTFNLHDFDGIYSNIKILNSDKAGQIENKATQFTLKFVRAISEFDFDRLSAMFCLENGSKMHEVFPSWLNKKK
jgi:hypothetical protein